MTRTKERKKAYYSTHGDGFWNEFAQYFEEPSGLYEKLKKEEYNFAKCIKNNTSLTDVKIALEPDKVNQLMQDAKALTFTGKSYGLLGSKNIANQYIRKAMKIMKYAADRSRYDQHVVQKVADAHIDFLKKRL